MGKFFRCLTYSLLLAFSITLVGLPVYYQRVCPKQPRRQDGHIHGFRYHGPTVYLTDSQKHTLLLPVGLLVCALLTGLGMYPK